MAKAGYEVKHGRGDAISFRAKVQERFTRLRSSTLGKGYGPEDIRAVIEGCAAPSGAWTELPPRVNLIIDIQARIKNGKGPAYERWAKIFNFKQMAATLQHLQENGLLEYVQLEKRAAYKEYRAVRKDMQEVVTAKANIDRLFGLTDTQKNKEQER